MKDNRKNRVAARGLLFLSIATFVVLGGCETPLSDALARISDNGVKSFWVTNQGQSARINSIIQNNSDGTTTISLSEPLSLDWNGFLTHWETGALKVTNSSGVEETQGNTIFNEASLPLDFIFIAASGDSRNVTVYNFKLTAPTNFKGAQSGMWVYLTWDASGVLSETGFEIQRDVDNSFPNPIDVVTTEPDTEGYDDSITVGFDTWLYYRIRSIDSGNGSVSNWVGPVAVWVPAS